MSDMLCFQGTLRSLAGVPLVYTSFGMDQDSLLFLCRIWRLLVVRQPLSDSDGETPRRINGVVQSPQHLWDVGCRIYMTAVPDVFRAWRTEAKWRADGGDRAADSGGQAQEEGRPAQAEGGRAQ